MSVNRSEIVHELIQIYQSIGNGNRTEEDIVRCKVEIDNILKRKDKLLDLSIGGRISDKEFSKRNDRFNEEIGRLRLRLSELKEEKRKNQDMLQSIEALRQAITEELSFADGFSISIVDSLLDHIEVHPREEKDTVKVSVYLKAILRNEIMLQINERLYLRGLIGREVYEQARVRIVKNGVGKPS